MIAYEQANSLRTLIANEQILRKVVYYRRGPYGLEIGNAPIVTSTPSCVLLVTGVANNTNVFTEFLLKQFKPIRIICLTICFR